MVGELKSHHKAKHIKIQCQNESLQTVMSKVKDTCTGFIDGQLYRAGGHKVSDIFCYKTLMPAVNDSMTRMLIRAYMYIQAAWITNIGLHNTLLLIFNM